MNIEDESWQRLADIEFNARLRNEIELLMMAPTETRAGAAVVPAGALSEDAMPAEIEFMEPTRLNRRA